MVPHHQVVDVSKLAFIDSAGLKLLLRASHLVDGRIAIRGASYFHRRLLEIADLSESFCMEEDDEEAHRLISELQAS